MKYFTVCVLPIDYLTESLNCYQSDNQVGRYNHINSPIDYKQSLANAYYLQGILLS